MLHHIVTDCDMLHVFFQKQDFPIKYLSMPPFKQCNDLNEFARDARRSKFLAKLNCIFGNGENQNPLHCITLSWLASSWLKCQTVLVCTVAAFAIYCTGVGPGGRIGDRGQSITMFPH